MILTIGLALLMVVVLASAVAAVLAKSLLGSTVALGIGSASLAAIFFVFGAPYAGSFELSVGAGLISALIIITISLSESFRGVKRGP